MPHDLRHVGSLHESVVRGDLEEAPTEVLDLRRRSAVRHLGDRLGDDREQDDRLVEDAVVLPVVQEDDRHAVRVRRHEHRRPAHPVRLVRVDVGEEGVDRQEPAREGAPQERAPRLPRGHHEKEREGDGDRKPPAAHELHRVGREEGDVEAQKEHDERERPPERPLPRAPEDHVVDDRRDPHRAGDGDPVRRGERARLLERDDEADARDGERRVDLGDIDLPLGLSRRVQDRDARAEAELHRLARQRVGARDERLRRDDRRHRREHHHRIDEDRRDDRVERVLGRCRGAG